MSLASVLTKLLAGEYICPIAFRPEYETLCDPHVAAEVDQWLGKLDMRLARLHEQGAFFMAPALLLGSPSLARARDSLLNYRNEYGPMVTMLNIIRQAGKDGLTFSMGDYIQLAELETSVSEHPALETQLRNAIGVVREARQDDSNRTVLKRLLEHLRREGFVVLANEKTENYQFTGKVDQIHAVLDFIAENQAIPDESDLTADMAQTDLLDLARAAADGN
jgi:hypothetical protein